MTNLGDLVVERDPTAKSHNPSQFLRRGDPGQQRDDAPLRETPDDDALFRDLGVLDLLSDELFEGSHGLHETGFVVDPPRVRGKVVQGRNIEPSTSQDESLVGFVLIQGLKQAIVPAHPGILYPEFSVIGMFLAEGRMNFKLGNCRPNM